MTFDMSEHSVTDRRLAELARHSDVLCVIEVLVTEEDNLPLKEGVAYYLQLFQWQRLREVNASYLGTDMNGQRDDLDHCLSSSIV
jgi:hypothetical protein